MAIETGRFRNKKDELTGEFRKLHVNERICQLCNDGMEDELHFTLKCPVYNIPRLLLLNKCHIDNILQDIEKYKILMTDYWKDMVDYVYDAWQIRKRRLFNQ